MLLLKQLEWWRQCGRTRSSYPVLFKTFVLVVWNILVLRHPVRPSPTFPANHKPGLLMILKIEIGKLQHCLLLLINFCFLKTFCFWLSLRKSELRHWINFNIPLAGVTSKQHKKVKSKQHKQWRHVSGSERKQLRKLSENATRIQIETTPPPLDSKNKSNAPQLWQLNFLH